MFRKKFFAMNPDNDNIALFSGMFCRLFERFRLVIVLDLNNLIVRSPQRIGLPVYGKAA